MRHDVIDVGGADVLTFLQALHTERVCFEVLLASSPPCCAVTTGGSAGTVAAVSTSVLFTVLFSIRHEPRAAGMLAGCVRSARHSLHKSPFGKLLKAANIRDELPRRLHDLREGNAADSLITDGAAVLYRFSGFLCL